MNAAKANFEKPIVSSKAINVKIKEAKASFSDTREVCIN